MATLKTVWLLATFLAIFDNPYGYLEDVLATSFFSPNNQLGPVFATIFCQFHVFKVMFSRSDINRLIN